MSAVSRTISFAVIVIISFSLIAHLEASGQFLETRSSTSVLSDPLASVSGDFNGDGKADLAVAAFYNGELAVLLGNGDGTFQRAVYYPVGGNETANSVAAADLRGNGILDLIVTNSINKGVEVLLGNGDGTFAPAIFYGTVAKPFYIAAGDFTNNGHPGIVALTYGVGNCACIEVLPGNGDGTLGSPIFTENVGNTTALEVGNFNGGHNLDLAVAVETGFNIYLGKGNGTFTLGTAYAISSPPGSIAAASFRKNGILDLAVSLPFGGGVAVYLGNGDGTFTEGETVPAGFATPAIAGDINGDGNPDLLALTGYPNLYLTTYLGNGDGTFQAPVNYPLSYGGVSVSLGDFNGDKKADVAISNNSGNNVITMLNSGVVSFSPVSPLNFKKQAVGTKSVAQKVTLTNTGKTVLKISSMKASPQFGMTSTCGSTVAAGASCVISVTFSPTSQGAKSGTVTINDSASSKPMVIELSGTGI